MKQKLTDKELQEDLSRSRSIWRRLHFPRQLECRFQQESREAALLLLGLAHKKISLRIFSFFLLTFSLALTTALILLLEPLYPQSYFSFLMPALILLGIYSRLPMSLLLLGFFLNGFLAQSLLVFIFSVKVEPIFIYPWIATSFGFWLLANLFERIQREQFLLNLLLEENAKDEIQEAERQPVLVGLDRHTGLSNSLSFDRALLVEWKRSARTQRSIALIFIQVISAEVNLDNKTDIQSKKLLAQLGEVLRNHARRPGDISAYLDKQRFVVLLAETELKNAHQVAMKLRDALVAVAFHDEFNNNRQVGANLAVYSQVPEQGSLIALDLMQEAWTTLEISLQEKVNQVVCLG